MKAKWFGRSLTTFLLILIAILIFTRFLLKSNNQINVTEPVPFPTSLHPVVEERANQLMQRSAEKGIVIVITDDFRSSDDQDQLYEKGRSIEGQIVTNARGGESYHNFGLAIDFAIKTGYGNVIWDIDYDGNGNGHSDWKEVVDIAKDLGFEWGGDWTKFKDYPHLQMDFGLPIADLQNGKRPLDSSLSADKN